LLSQHAGDIAGIIVEPLVQGAGGMKFHDAKTLKTLRRLADKYDLLLIFDEIFTALAAPARSRLRAGRRHARHHHAVEGAHGGTLGLALPLLQKKCSTHSGRTIRKKV